MENLQYPIGRFDNTKEVSPSELKKAIAYLAAFPKILNELTSNLSDEVLDKTYRPDGWSIRQVVHHIADSHGNMFIRLKCALTEENPTIKGYSEGAWANLSDSKLPITVSLPIIEGLHIRLNSLLNSMSEADFEKTFYHPGYQRTYVLKGVVALYAWHSEHHLEHIKIAINN